MEKIVHFNCGDQKAFLSMISGVVKTNPMIAVIVPDMNIEDGVLTWDGSSMNIYRSQPTDANLESAKSFWLQVMLAAGILIGEGKENSDEG